MLELYYLIMFQQSLSVRLIPIKYYPQMMSQIVKETNIQSKRHPKTLDTQTLIIINVRAKKMPHQYPKVVESLFKVVQIFVTQQMQKHSE